MAKTGTRLRYVDSEEKITRAHLFEMTKQAESDNVSSEHANSLTVKELWELTEDAIATRIDYGILEYY